MMDRTFTQEQNGVIVEKAIRYADRGIVGVDIAGPRPDGGRYPYRDLAPLVEEGRGAGLGITIHVGEEGGPDGIAEIGEVVETLRPERIGHGILAAQDEGTMRLLSETQTVLEICPTSNLLTGALPDEDALRDTLRAFLDRGVQFTIATDGPEMMRTHLQDELFLLVRLGALSMSGARAVNEQGHRVAFVHRTA
jgi:adenosine deaminase